MPLRAGQEGEAHLVAHRVGYLPLLANLWILRKFADSGKKHFRWKRADVLRKPNDFFDLL